MITVFDHNTIGIAAVVTAVILVTANHNVVIVSCGHIWFLTSMVSTGAEVRTKSISKRFEVTRKATRYEKASTPKRKTAGIKPTMSSIEQQIDDLMFDDEAEPVPLGKYAPIVLVWDIFVCMGVLVCW